MKKLFNSAIGVFAAILIIVGLSGCGNQPTEVQAKGNGLLVSYSDTLFKETKGKEPVALFFHADWCVTCRAIEDGLIANESDFPEGAKILRVNFDTETEIKKEYKVVMQSMLVFLDSDGNVAKKLAAPSIQEIIDTFKEVL